MRVAPRVCAGWNDGKEDVEEMLLAGGEPAASSERVSMTSGRVW